MATSERARSFSLPGPVPPVVLGGAAALVLGVALGLLLDPTALVGTTGYVFCAGFLLAVGLYGSTYGIDIKALRADLAGVLAAVTLGVVLKAALIAGVMVLAFGRPEYLVLGIAVAQIDPLSVAALGRSGQMSDRARSLLTAWASFDDPMTVLLTLYAAGYAYTASGRTGVPAVAGGGTRGYATGLALNAALLAVVLLLWWAGRKAAPTLTAASVPAPVQTPAAVPAPAAAPRGRRAGVLLAGLLVVAMLLVAAGNMLMLAVAVAGLAVRAAAFDKILGRAVTGAFLAAFLALGLFLAQGVRLWPGLLLGVSAFAAQAVVALLVMPLFVRGLDRRDRIALGLAQQNGITAVLIALTLERDFPGTVAVVGPAVVTVNLLYGGSQLLLAHPPRLWGSGPRARRRRTGGERPPAPAEPQPAGWPDSLT